MPALLKLRPFDPGSDHHPHHHGYAILNTFYLKIQKNFSIKENDQHHHQLILPKAIALIYVILRFFLCFCVACLKKVTTHQFGHKSDVVDNGQQSALALATKVYQTGLSEKTGAKKKQPNFQDVAISGPAKSSTYDFTYFRKLPYPLKKSLQTTYTTVIFEVTNAGLNYVAKDVAREMRNFHEVDTGDLMACCEAVWSVPSKYRSYWSEVMVKNEILQMMRVNNQRVYDKICAGHLGLQRASRGGRVQEADGTADGAYAGIYRHFYPELLDVAHSQSKVEHDVVWKFDSNSMKINVNWPIANDFTTTTVVALNFICVRFEC